MFDTTPNVHTPKRKGPHLDAPSKQRARTSRDTDDYPEGDALNQNGLPAWKDENEFRT